MEIDSAMEKRSGSLNVNFTGIARELGISVMTVYRVVNDLPCVRRETRVRVLEALNRHGYFTHKPHKNLKVLFDFTEHAYLTHYGTRLMHNIMKLNGLCYECNHRKNRTAFLDAAAECDVAVFVSIPDAAVIEEARSVNPDLYTITISTRSSADVTLSPDNTRGGELAARHFHAMGHRHIAVHLSETHPTRMERYKAFFAEMKLLDPECRIDRIVERPDEPTVSALRNYFESVDPFPTGIFFLAGAFAEVFLTEFSMNGPEKYKSLSVMTFDRPEDLEFTRLHYNFDRIEFISPDLLDWAEYYITNRPMMKKRSPIHTTIDVRLVVTGSVRRIDSSGATS